MFCGILKTNWSLDEANYHLLGVPLDISSTYRTGARFAPDHFRKILLSENFECVSENNMDLSEYYRIKDWGNVGIISTNFYKSLQFVSDGVFDLIGTNQNFLVFGGDHSSVIGIGHAFEKANLPTFYFYIDAHLDLYNEVKESTNSHACTLRRISELESFQGAVVLGYRDFSVDQIEYAKASNIGLFSTSDLLRESDIYQFTLNLAKNLEFNSNRIHISVDLDVLDPSFAPAVGNPVGIGISTRNLIELLKGLFEGLRSKQIISWDIVEFNPLYDQSDITAFNILKILIESLGAQISI
jgi:agmatinase